MNRARALLLTAALLTCSAPALAQGSGPNAFTEAMFGHIGVVTFDCPSEVVELAGSDMTAICGMETDSFSIFKQEWDLYADWESKVPIVPLSMSAWKYDAGRYSRSYALDNEAYIINFFEPTADEPTYVIALYSNP